MQIIQRTPGDDEEFDRIANMFSPFRKVDEPKLDWDGIPGDMAAAKSVERFYLRVSYLNSSDDEIGKDRYARETIESAAKRAIEWRPKGSASFFITTNEGERLAFCYLKDGGDWEILVSSDQAMEAFRERSSVMEGRGGMLDPEKADLEIGHGPNEVKEDGTRIYHTVNRGRVMRVIYHPDGEVESSVFDWRAEPKSRPEPDTPAVPLAAKAPLKRRESPSFARSCAVAILFGIYGMSQLIVGNMGIHHYWGGVWAFILTGLSFATGIFLPVSIGAFFGAKDVLGWHWGWAFAFAFPGLAFTIAAWIGQVPFSVLQWLKRKN